MTNVTKHGLVLQKRELHFEQQGVLNPAVIIDQGTIKMYYRAVARDNHSTIGYCTLSSPTQVETRLDRALLAPEFDYESQGMEDPRIVKIDNLYYLSYTAYDGKNAFGCVATSTDGVTFKKRGTIVPQFRGNKFRGLLGNVNINNKYYQPDKGNHFIWDKNVMFFPRRVQGRLAFLHRIRPGIQIAYCNEISDLTNEYWEDYLKNLPSHIALDPKYDHEMSYIGGGCPPIETPHGWLMIYHGVHDTMHGYHYSACAALLDLRNPEMEVARLPVPLFVPDESWEQKGYVNNVCFPTGAIVIDEDLYMFYGAADERIACASVKLPELISELLKYQTT